MTNELFLNSDNADVNCYFPSSKSDISWTRKNSFVNLTIELLPNLTIGLGNNFVW